VSDQSRAIGAGRAFRPGSASGVSLTAFAALDFFLKLALRFVGELGFALAQLAGDFRRRFVYCSIQIAIGFLGVDVRTGNGEMNLNAKSLLRIAFFVLKENYVRGNDGVREFFQMTYLVCDVRMDRRCQREVPWTEMYLHRKYLTVFFNGCQYLSMVKDPTFLPEIPGDTTA